MDWLESKPDTFQYHLEHPEIDLWLYAREKRLALGREIASRYRIYLDTKYWVYLCEVAVGRPKCSLHTQMLELLLKLHITKKVICPVSYSIFVELMRQSDLNTRLTTAKIVDQLSEGCCLQPPHELIKEEVAHFLFSTIAPNRHLDPVMHAVWTKASFLLGDIFLKSESFPADIASAMERSMDVLLWSISLEEFVKSLSTEDWLDPNIDRINLAATLTEGKVRHADDFDNFHDLLCCEIAGGLESFWEMLGDLMMHLSRRLGYTGQPSKTERDQAGRCLANLIVAAFKCNRVGTRLPGIHIDAGLHAAVRNDRTRKYKANDFDDFRHASSALPYCDCFFTDRSLCQLIRAKPLEFNGIYGTMVLADDVEIVSKLEELAK